MCALLTGGRVATGRMLICIALPSKSLSMARMAEQALESSGDPDGKEEGQMDADEEQGENFDGLL
eukprot:5670190-Pyramimonas_sp.AAC.1